MEQYFYRPAITDDLDRIWEIILQAKQQMYREKKHQWDESYPSRQIIMDDINRHYGYVLCVNDVVIAYAAVIFDGEPAYNHIEGEWLSNEKYVVVHRLAVADEMKQKGIARLFFDKTENLAKQKGLKSFKVDTNYDNFYMQKLLNKCGFTLCGNIFYEKGSRMAYEKIIIND